MIYDLGMGEIIKSKNAVYMSMIILSNLTNKVAFMAASG
jgi:hypothetical protein